MVAVNTFSAEERGGGAQARRAAEARLVESRRKHDEALARKKASLKEFAEACKADRRVVRDHVREMRARSLRDLRDQTRAARGAAKLTRLTRLAEVRQVAGAAVEGARAAAAVERQHQAELARIEREERARRIEIRLAHERALAAGELRSALFGKLAPFFQREGRSVTQAPGESRAEALLRFAERNSEKAHAAVEPSVHRKVEETKRALAEAERAARVVGGDVRVGTGRRAKDQQDGARAQSPSPLEPAASPPPALPPSPAAPVQVARVKPARGLGKPRPAKKKAAKRAAKVAKPRAPKASETSPAGPKSPEPRKSPKDPPARRKGQIPPGGMLLGDFMRERAEMAAAKVARGKRSTSKKKAAGKPAPVPPPSIPPLSAASVVPKTSYAAWCELVSQAAGKHGRRVAFGPETHGAWRSGQDAESFVLTLPETRMVPATIVREVRDLRARAANTNTRPSLPGGTPKPIVVTSTIADSVRPYKVRASCGHVVVRPMRAATAGVTYSEHVILDAPKGRACDACEAKQNSEKHAPSSKAVDPHGERAPTARGGAAFTLEPSPGPADGVGSGRKKRGTRGVQQTLDLNSPLLSARNRAAAKPDAGPGGSHLERAEPAAPKKNDVKAPELKDTAEIAKRIRADIAEAVRAKTLPKASYSVRTDKYSMGSSIYVVASKLPFPVLNPDAFHFEKGSSYMEFDRERFRSRYTPEADAVLAKLNAIVDAYHWDRSDPMSDYYNERFGRDVKLDDQGQWDRINEEKVAAARAAQVPGGAQS